MSIFSRFKLMNKKSTAQIAKERLQIIVSHESGRRRPGSKDAINIQALKEKLITVVAEYLNLEREQVESRIKVELDKDRSILELDVSLPEQM